MSKTVILDTSVLTAAVAARVDIADELHRLGCFGSLQVFAGTINELTSLASGMSSQATFAKIALDMIKRWTPTVLAGTTSHVDDDIVAYAKTQPCIVATQDADLRRRLHKNHTQTISVRQQNHLAFD